MLNLIFAPSADTLVPLAENRIREAWGDPFDPPAIIVPNPAVGKWLRARLAEPPAFGCVANARLLTLEKFLWNALEPEAGVNLIDRERLAQVICAVLEDAVCGDGAYAPLRNYLYGGNHHGNRIDALKRVQLSARIAQQFLEYEYNRPSVWNESENRWGRHGIDAKWILGKFYFDKKEREHEAWQMDLYRKVFCCYTGDESARYTSLPHLYRRRREERAKEKRPWCDVGSNKKIILFGVSKISHFHRNTLVEISQMDGVDMHVFLTNPCAEFWEDVDTSRRSFIPRRRWNSDSSDDDAGIKPVKPGDYDKPELDMFADEEDHALLKLWGGAGKENIFLWCPQAQWNFEYYPDTAFDTDGTHPDTLLKSIQKSLLKRSNNLDLTNVSSNLTNDGSIKILACPDVGREVEELRELVQDIADAGKINSFNDIAVYMPDPNKYLPHIQRVFGAYSQNHPLHIPFTILGASAGSSMAARAIFTLLNIIDGNFNRAEIFELLRNPIVWASKKITPGKAAQWEYWAEEFGMFRGFNAKQRGNMGDMGGAATDEHTFERGMAKVMAGIDAGDGSDNDMVINTITTTDTDRPHIKASAETFLSLLEELNELSALFTKNNSALDIHEAVELTENAIRSWLGTIPADGSVDNTAETRVRQEALDGLGLIRLQNTLAGRAKIGLDEFIALARDRVPTELAVPPSAWSGITFAPLRASMVLPHRAIFVLGLGATEFPGTNEKGSWDLLSRKRIVGDSDTVRDNRFAFLELLHAAKEYLTLSYRARDLQKDELLQPSSVIPELEEYLVGQGLTVNENSRYSLIRRDIPWIVHESLDAARKAGRGHGTWDRAQRELAEKAAEEKVRHRHEISRANNKTVSTDDKNKYCADLRDFKLFFGNPLEYHLYRTLGIRDENEIDMAETDEPLESGYKLSALRKKIWIAVLGQMFSSGRQELAGAAVSEANKIYDEHIDSGQAPEGHFCRMEREELQKWAKECAAAAADKLLIHFHNHQFIENDIFSLDCGQFTISGDYALTIIPKNPKDKSQTIGILSFDSGKKPELNPNLWLEGLLWQIDEIRERSACPIILITLNHGDSPDVNLFPINMESGKLPEMENWLIEILSQMLIEKRSEHLPLKIITEMTKPEKRKKGQEVENFEKRLQKLTFFELKNELAKGDYKNYLRALKLTDAKPAEMSDGELRQLVNLRYAPMFEGRDDE
ncbi:MAG: exodeoxyribonuclease V subunit gamma [Chitinispirillales bacterium]|jgi:exonuclease V gamma subunit|nr:exodeoxyribonuclease V subunit gamma [Chitinispirillales bacterium]